MQDEGETQGRIPAWADWLGGAAIGILLGLMIGLSATPVVSMVISGLVALLGGLFGLSESSPFKPSLASARRLIGFALAAAILTPVGMHVRTHNSFAPSLADQKADLATIGYADGSDEQREMLLYLRYGLLPKQATEAEKASVQQSVLYSDLPAGLCGEISRLSSAEDLIVVLSQSKAPLPKMAEALRALPAADRASAVAHARVFLCAGE